jgi:hypothetical protein
VSSGLFAVMSVCRSLFVKSFGCNVPLLIHPGKRHMTTGALLARLGVP